MQWNVMLDGEVIDRVWFLKECDADHVRRALIHLDGFDPRFEVVRYLVEKQ